MSKDLSSLFDESLNDEDIFAQLRQVDPMRPQSPTHNENKIGSVFSATRAVSHSAGQSPFPIHNEEKIGPIFSKSPTVMAPTRTAPVSVPVGQGHTSPGRPSPFPTHNEEKVDPIFSKPPPLSTRAAPVSMSAGENEGQTSPAGRWESRPPYHPPTHNEEKVGPIFSKPPSSLVAARAAPIHNNRGQASPGRSESQPSLVSAPQLPTHNEEKFNQIFSKPLSPPSSKPPSLIAARRAAATTAQPLIQPEQDVIYRTPGQPEKEIIPPEIGVLHQTPKPSQNEVIFKPSGQSQNGIPYQTPKQLEKDMFNKPPGQPLMQRPVIPTMPGLTSLDVAPVPAHEVRVNHRPDHRPYTPGLMSVCLGFGGRIAVGTGTTIGLGRVSALLPLSAVPPTDFPCPLGAPSALVSEQLESMLVGRSGVVSPGFSFSSVPEYVLMHLLLRSVIGGGSGGPFSQLFQHLVDSDPSLNASQSEVSSWVRAIVRGDMQAVLDAPKRIPMLYPYAMGIASIHSGEVFRECLVTFARDFSMDVQSFIPSPADLHLLRLVQSVIEIFGSTNSSDIFPTSLDLSEWKSYLCLVGSLARTSSNSRGAQFLLRLGDALVRKNQVVPGHICMLVSGLRFQLDSVDSPTGLLCLLGVDHRRHDQFSRLLDFPFLLWTEIFEYSLRLLTKDPNFFFQTFVPFKFALAHTLAADFGHFDTAEKYLQVVSGSIRSLPANRYSPTLRNRVRELESRITESYAVHAKISSHPKNNPPALVSEVGYALWGGIKTVIEGTVKRANPAMI